MKPLCYLFRTDLVRYLDNELAAKKVQRVEDHLAGCGRCRENYLRLRAARSFAKKLPYRTPETDGWPALEMALNSQKRKRRAAKRIFATGIRRPAAASIVIAALGILMMGSSLIIATVRSGSGRPGDDPALARIDPANFRQVSIDQIKNSNDPHVVAEGYVTDISVDEEDGDLTFRLVSDPKKPDSFVVCEIIDSIRLTVPNAGSRVRVYGVSRYDGQDGHNWYEVHPVLGIEPASR